MRRTLDCSLQIMSSSSQISSLLFVSAWASLWVHVHCSYSKRKPCKWNADDHIRAVYKVILDNLILYLLYFFSLIFKRKFVQSWRSFIPLWKSISPVWHRALHGSSNAELTKCTKALRTVRVKNYQSNFHRTAPTGSPPILRTSLPLLDGHVKCMSSITFSYCNMQVVLLKSFVMNFS